MVGWDRGYFGRPALGDRGLAMETNELSRLGSVYLRFGGYYRFRPIWVFDHVTVTEERLQTKWGFWMALTLHDIAFDDVAGVNLTKEITRGRRGRHTLGFRPDLGNQGKLGVDDDFSLRLSVVPDPNDSEKAVIQSWLNGDSTAEIPTAGNTLIERGP